MENIINEDRECRSERVNIILKSLSRPKYQENENNDSDSDSDDEYVYNKFFSRS